MSKNTTRNKYVKILIITLVAIQGLYVVFPLPDIWPISNYSMFSRAKVKTVASKLEIRGVTTNSDELLLNAKDHFHPLDSSRINKGISRILNDERYRRKNEKRVDRIIGYFDFLPINKTRLKETIQGRLLYDSEVKDKKEAMDKFFSYLLAQYKFNGEMSGTGERIHELRLYRVEWDWTETQIHNVIPKEELIYSTTTDLFQHE